MTTDQQVIEQQINTMIIPQKEDTDPELKALYALEANNARLMSKGKKERNRNRIKKSVQK